MTRAVLYRDQAARFTGFSIRGHAGYRESGFDIVCAAISSLSTTCINALESICGITPEVSGGEDGRLAMTLPPSLTEAQQHDAQVLLGALWQGLSDLAEAYPKNLKFSIEERREIP